MPYTKSLAAAFLIILLLLGLLLLFITSTISLYQKKQLSFIDKLQEAKIKYERELLKVQLEVQLETMDHMSRELHDNIGHQFTVAKLYLNTIILPPGHPSTPKFAEAIDMLTKGLEDLRNLSKSLSLDLIRSIGLRKAIDAQVLTLQKLQEFQVNYAVHGPCDYDEEQTEIIVFRIFQQAINNIIRHAQATTIHITLDSTIKDRLVLIVADDGKGFVQDPLPTNTDPDQPAGLRNMQVRARLINADISITSTPGQGTRVALSVPLATDSFVLPGHL